MKRSVFVALIVTVAVVVGAWGVQRASADDETGNVEIKIQAPLQQVDCTANTITVLGLTIDISTASIDNESDGSDMQGGDTSGSDSGTGSDDGSGGTGGTGCAALTMGQTVEVKLGSDSAPLTATEVSQEGDDQVEISAPVQAVDTTGMTIQLLGLTIDVSMAWVGGDDEDGNTSGQTVDLTQLMMGTFVKVQLDSDQPPLKATELEVKAFTNQVEVDVEDQSGTEVDDGTDDMDVDVTETVTVQAPAGSSTRHVKTVLHFHRAAHGKFLLSGLPTGRAKITLTRNASGTSTAAKKGVSIHGNSSRTLKMHLRRSR